MARIRTIKPELPQSESLGRVTRDARLLFVNLFTIADDAGRLRGQSRLLASLLYPYDDGEGVAKTTGAEIEGWLAELEREGCIACYEVDGVEYIQITKWLEHQKIDRPSPSRIPEYVPKPREDSRVSDALPSTLDLGPRTNPPKPPKGGDAYSDEFSSWWEAYPHKVGKDAAWRAWKRRKDRPQLADLIAATKRYIATKPAEREFCNPATWLNQGRWKDQPANATSDTQNKDDPELARWRIRTKNWAPGKFWNRDMWGPAPNEPGTRVPRELLEAA